MCTAVSYLSDHFYFGRNLDWTDACGGKIVICPRNFPVQFRNGTMLKNHLAFIGVAAVEDNFPLYFDAINEKGLCVAGLNFPDNACYHPLKKDRINIASFELIPWLLGNFSSADQAIAALENVSIWNCSFSETLPASPLHWLIADKKRSFTLESTTEGLQIYDNPFGILTNSPPFPYHAANVAQFCNLTNRQPANNFSAALELRAISFGLGAVGLPGDPSSPSRFVRAAFTKWNSPQFSESAASLSHFFHILGAVEQPMGVNMMADGHFEHTVYSSCCDTDAGVYYWKTYHASLCSINMHDCDLEDNDLNVYPLE